MERCPPHCLSGRSCKIGGGTGSSGRAGSTKGGKRMAQPGRVSRKHLKILCRQLELPNGQSHAVSWQQTSDIFRPWSQHTPCLAVAQVLFLQLGCTDELACAPAEPCPLCFSRAKAMFVSQRNCVERSLSGPRLRRAEDRMSPELMGSRIGTTIC